jgi:hypothetical protein
MNRWITAFCFAAAVGCASDATAPTPPVASGRATFSRTNTNGIGGAMPAFYDGTLFTINFKEIASGGEAANLLHDGSINIIYQSDGCSPGGKMFVSVIDAIQGDGFNPLWQEVQLVFPNPSACQQFTSDTQILAAAASGVVQLVPTTELYRCSVIGKSD